MRLVVYDVLGREVAALVDGVVTAGQHEVTVDATAWASGLYVYSLETQDSRVTRNMVLLR